jgi:hypothetical protein
MAARGLQAGTTQTTCLAFTCFLIAAIWLAVSPWPSLLPRLISTRSADRVIFA